MKTKRISQEEKAFQNRVTFNHGFHDAAWTVGIVGEQYGAAEAVRDAVNDWIA